VIEANTHPPPSIDQNRAVADVLGPVVGRLSAKPLPFTIRFWDGSEIPARGHTTLVIRSPRAVEHVLHEPNELGLTRAWVTGDLDIEGSIEAGLAAAEELPELRLRLRDRLAFAIAAFRLGAALLHRPPIPASEARLSGRRMSLRRARDAVAYAYDLPDAFYELVLGPTRGYTCGYYQRPDDSLEESQLRKFDLVCSKLDLQSGERLLDIGCGWGTLMIHAARHYGARVVGVTISRSQAEEVQRRIQAAGVADRCEVRLCDWREIDDGPYDKLAIVEMIEHVGVAQLPRFFRAACSLVAPGSLVFTQAIVRDRQRELNDRRFLPRYIFPDGEFPSFLDVLDAVTSQGLEVRDVESLRAHYPPTLRGWSTNLDTHRDEAIELVGTERVRAWDIYLAASYLAFERGRLSVHQILAAAPPARTASLLRPCARSDQQRSTIVG
jgi:cyclopropane-fatty-acyl-phospholipid synthase